MPEFYEGVKRSFLKLGMGEDEAEMHAARIYNAQKKPGDPDLHHGKKKKHKKKEKK